MSLNPYLTPDVNVNLKYIINIKIKTIKPLEEHKREYFPGLGAGKGFVGHGKQ